MFGSVLGPLFYIYFVVVQTLADLFESAQASFGAALLLAAVVATVCALVSSLVVAARCATQMLVAVASVALALSIARAMSAAVVAAVSSCCVRGLTATPGSALVGRAEAGSAVINISHALAAGVMGARVGLAKVRAGSLVSRAALQIAFVVLAERRAWQGKEAAAMASSGAWDVLVAVIGLVTIGKSNA